MADDKHDDKKDEKSYDEDLELSDEDLEAVAGGRLTTGAASAYTNAGWTGTDQPINCCGDSGCFPHPTTNIYCRIGQTVTLSCSGSGSSGIKGPGGLSG